MDNEEQERKKMNDDMVVFLRKRSETETPRYAARLHAYVDLQRKRSRAAAAKKRSEHERKIPANKKKGEIEQKEKNADNSASISNAARRSNCGLVGEHPGTEDDRMSRRRGGDKTGVGRTRSFSRSRSAEPSDRGCRKRRRSCSRRPRRRRRSCRRRRRSCRRRRRRRSCGRRRRRRSCSRRRRRRRRRSIRRRRRRRCR